MFVSRVWPCEHGGKAKQWPLPGGGGVDPDVASGNRECTRNKLWLPAVFTILPSLRWRIRTSSRLDQFLHRESLQQLRENSKLHAISLRKNRFHLTRNTQHVCNRQRRWRPDRLGHGDFPGHHLHHCRHVLECPPPLHRSDQEHLRSC
jgi:hypothetical protein